MFWVFLFILPLCCRTHRYYDVYKPWESHLPPLPQPPTTTPGPAVKTRSLSGTFTTDGSTQTNADVMKLITVGLLDGYAIRRVKAFNDRVHLDRYRRSYWLGTRYYELDNRYYLATRDTCVYRLDGTERRNLEYEDGEWITDVVYQCQRYAQYCCGLDCCNIQNKREALGLMENHSAAYATLLPFLIPILHLLIVNNNH